MEVLLTIKVENTGLHRFDHSRKVAIKLKLQCVSTDNEHYKKPNLEKKKTYWNKDKTFIKEQSIIFKIIAAPENNKKARKTLRCKSDK